MKDAGVATEAVVLRRFDYSEASQIARLYTRAYGRVPVLAKGIRRPNPDLLGPMDLGAHGEAWIRPKQGDALSLLTRWRTITGFPGQRRALERLTGAARVCELWCEGTRDFDPDPALFDLLTESLAALEAAAPEAVLAVVLAAELGWLGSAGFAPALDRCTACGKEAPANAATRLAPGRGGILCARCLEPSTPGLVPLTAGERRTLVLLLEAGPARAAVVRLGAKDGAVLCEALERLLEHALEKELRSSRYLREFLVPGKTAP